MATGEKGRGERSRFFTTEIRSIKDKLKMVASKASSTAHIVHSGQ